MYFITYSNVQKSKQYVIFVAVFVTQTVGTSSYIQKISLLIFCGKIFHVPQIIYNLYIKEIIIYISIATSVSSNTDQQKPV